MTNVDITTRMSNGHIISAAYDLANGFDDDLLRLLALSPAVVITLDPISLLSPRGTADIRLVLGSGTTRCTGCLYTDASVGLYMYLHAGRPPSRQRCLYLCHSSHGQ